MALIDVVRHEMIDGEFCHKFPSTDLRIGTQLIVYPSQTAFLVKGGVICDEFLSIKTLYLLSSIYSRID